MKTFIQQRAGSAAHADAIAKPGAKIIAGGTNLLDPMQFDINRLPLDKIEWTAGGGLRIGTLA